MAAVVTIQTQGLWDAALASDVQCGAIASVGMITGIWIQRRQLNDETDQDYSLLTMIVVGCIWVSVKAVESLATRAVVAAV